MPFANEHAARLVSPGGYKRFRRDNAAGGPGVDLIYGVKDDEDGGEVVELQAIRFATDKFSADEAKTWLDDHEYEVIEFEEAVGDAALCLSFAGQPIPFLLDHAEDASAQTGESDVPFRRWLQIAKIGIQPVEGYDEPYELTDGRASQIVSVFQHRRDHGHDTIFDYNHGSIRGGSPEATGKAGLVLEMEHRSGDGIWALGEFTDRAASFLKGGDFHKTSPEIHSHYLDFESGEWIEGPAILAVALTARPQLGGMEAIAASKSWQTLAVALDTDAPNVATMIHAAIADLARAGKFGEVEEGGEADEPVSLVQIAEDITSVIVRNNRTNEYYGASVVERNGRLQVEDIARGGLLFHPADDTNEETKTMADKGTMIPVDENVAEAQAMLEKLAPLLEAIGERTADEVTKALALLDAAGEQVAVEDVQALALGQGQDDALRLHVNTLAADLQASKSEIQALSAKLQGAELEKQRHSAEALLDRYPTRVTPSQRPWLLSQALKDADGTEAFIQSLPETINLGGSGTRSAAAPAAMVADDAPKTLDSLILSYQAAEKADGRDVDYATAWDAVRDTDEGRNAESRHYGGNVITMPRAS